MKLQAPKGTRDIFGEEACSWLWLEDHIKEVCRSFGFGEIRMPIFEHTELFLRGVGETTDVVQKEMYTFNDKGGRSITLRPEMTASAARAFVENGLFNEPMPVKLYYIGPNFRYENPQAGRMRQFHQFGVEIFGSGDAAADAEIIAIGYALLQRLKINGASVHINSLGCSTCRKEYRKELQAFVGDNLAKLCEDCRRRFDKNPLRALDCKVEKCQEVMGQAQSVLDFLDQDCKAHFETLQNLLKGMDIPFEVNSKIVRGLDYYVRTVFEFVAEGIPTIIGGGRYDGLIEEVSGQPDTETKTPAIGFAMGMDRLLILLKNQKLLPEDLSKPCQIYIGHAGAAGYEKSQILVHALRAKNIAAESDLINRSVKAQMKYAGKRSAAFSMIIGDNELAEGSAKLKNMETGQQEEVDLTAEEIIRRIQIGR